MTTASLSVAEQQKANRKKWVDALRSGEYKQTTGQLRKTPLGAQEPRFCCLGVACDLFVKEGLANSHWDDDEFIWGSSGYDAHGEHASLPGVVRDWLGLNTTLGAYFDADDRHDRSLVRDNDDRGFTFEDIADIIESEPSGFLCLLSRPVS